jgi:hypothetical protein
MRTTALTIIGILAAIGLLVGAVLLYIAAKIAAAAVLFLLFAAVVVWAVFRRVRGSGESLGTGEGRWSEVDGRLSRVASSAAGDSGDQAPLSGPELNAGSLEVVEMTFLHFFEGSQQTTCGDRILAPGLESTEQETLLRDELKSKRDRPLSLLKSPL